jgi:hypothetical protein
MYPVREIDECLVHSLGLIPDWLVFGSIGFNVRNSQEDCMGLWYKLIRSLEKKNQSEFVVRLEGDNELRNRHIHFLLAERGLIYSDFEELKNKINQRIEELRFNFQQFETASPHIEPFDYEKNGIAYIAKIAKDEKENLNGLGLDSAGCSNWKMSHRLKKRIRAINNKHMEQINNY